MHHVAPLSVQLGIGSTLVDWFRHVCSVPFVHLLIHLSPPTDDRLRYCTISGNIPSKIYVPTTWSIWNNWTMNTLNLSTLQAFQHFSLACKNSFSKNLSQRICPISQQAHRQHAAGKVVRSKKKSCDIVDRRNSWTVVKTNSLEGTKESTSVAKRIIAHKYKFPLRY